MRSKEPSLMYLQDGLLLDTESLIIDVARQVTLRYGVQLTDEAINAGLGKRPVEAWQVRWVFRGPVLLLPPSPSPNTVQATADTLGLAVGGEHLFAESEELLKERWPSVRMMPGALRLLRHLKQHGIPVGLATSTSSKHIHSKLSGKEYLLGLFDFKCFGDEVARGKPDREIYIEAARRGGLAPADCLVVEDSPCGVKSACAAGARCIAIPTLRDKSLYPPPDAARPSGCCSEMLASLLDFRPERYGLPAFDDYVAGDVVPLVEPPWRLAGPVVRGFGRGSKLLGAGSGSWGVSSEIRMETAGRTPAAGIPTANVEPGVVQEALGGAVCGIYCGWASVEGIPGKFPFAMSIGYNPVFGNEKKTAEPWLLGYQGEDFYGREIRCVARLFQKAIPPPQPARVFFFRQAPDLRLHPAGGQLPVPGRASG